MAEFNPEDVASASSGDGFARSTWCKYVELLQYSDHVDAVHKEGLLNDKSLPVWLHKGYDHSDQESKPLTGGLRLLLLHMEYSVQYIADRNAEHYFVSCTKDNYVHLEELFGLPQDFHLRSMKTFAYRYSKSTKDIEPVKRLIFKRAQRGGDFCHYALSYDARTRISHVVLLLGDKRDLEDGILRSLTQTKHENCLQPLLICNIISDVLIRYLQAGLARERLRVARITKTTGQHEYSDVPYSDPLEMDFLGTTRSLNFSSQRIAQDTEMLTSILGSLAHILAFHNDLIVALASRVKSDDTEAARKGSYDVEAAYRGFADVVEYLAESCRALLVTSSYLEKRIATLIQVVYQFMGQKDARTNIALVENLAAIAKAARDDGSSMKTVALLGMFFLPGAFVAAVFAIPFFEWGDDGSPTMRAGFKYYWAVTIPLALLVFLCWGLATLLPWSRWLANYYGKGREVLGGDIELPSR